MRQKEFLIIAITIFLTAIAWIAADLFHIAKTEQVKIEKGVNVRSIDFTVDVQLLDRLQQRQ